MGRAPRAGFGPAVAALLAALAPAAPARANGRFPQANQPALHPSDPTRLAVRTTFGALASDDGGKTFRWICETVAGYAGLQDPALALFGAASIAFAAEEGLVVSHDGGCSFAPAPGLPAAPARDVTLDRGAPGRLAALVTPVAGRAEVFLSDDDARSWRAAGPALPEGFEAETLELAGARLYVSGASGPDGARRGLVARLGDAGDWQIAEVALEGEASLYLAALDPSDAGRVYARADGAAGDRLLVSEDGAATFRTIVRSEGRLLGFALSPDGSKVAAGGPGVGVLAAARSDFAFSRKSATGVLGLAWGPGGLVAAADDLTTGYVVARSLDDGASFGPLLASFVDIAGPLVGCPAGGAFERTCAAEWPALYAELGGGGSPAAGGSGGAAGDEAGGGGPVAASSSRDGGCAFGGEAGAGAMVSAAGLAAGLAWARRARRAGRPGR